MEKQQLQQSNFTQQDTRTHVVGELYDTERSYVESLQILVEKYMKPLKGYDSNKTLIDSSLVDEIFYTIPEILQHHENFLSALQDRLSSDWDSSQVIGNVFIEAFTNQQIIDTYTAFINNWKNARHAIKVATQAKPAFERFLEAMSREHKNKLTLDALLIMPVQRIPRYELLIKELIKHTPETHPDHEPLIGAQKEIHQLALKIDQAEKEMLQQEQLRDIENLIEGHIELQHPQRDFIRYDLVTISASTTLAVAKKERVLFLFCDLLIMTSVKKKVSRRSNLQAAFFNSSNDLSLLEGNKFKLLLRVSLDQIEVKQDQSQQQQAFADQAQQYKNQQFLLAQQQQQQRHQMILLNEKRHEIETDLSLLQQIELIATKLNLAERNDLIGTVSQLSSQAHQDLVNLDYQQQRHQESMNEVAANQQDLYVIQQPTLGEFSADYQQLTVNNVEQQEKQASNSSTHEQQNTSLEFTIVNFATANDSGGGGGVGGMSANMSSSSMTSDYSGEHQQQQMINQLSGSGHNIDTNISAQVASCESLVVTFMSAERRQAFLQAFNEAKLHRLQQQQRSQHQKMFSSSLTLRLSSQEHSPVKSRSSIDSDLRRTRLQHQDEVDLRHLESLTAAIRNNRAVNTPATARISSAPHQTAATNNTIVHQMSAPQALASIGAELRAGQRRVNSATIQHCDTCSSSCVLDSNPNGSQSKSSKQHQNHHHHQLMHQPASQPAMLNMICCHNHHNDNDKSVCESQPSNERAFEDKSIVRVIDSNEIANERHQHIDMSALSLRFAPKFMLTIPMTFLASQHPALQFTCSASKKLFSSHADSVKIKKSQTIQDNLGQFWFCMSNGVVSHVALISFKKKKVFAGNHGDGTRGQQQQQHHVLKSNSQPNFQCYDVIPVVQSSGDICKAQINCAVHVGWPTLIKRREANVLSSNLLHNTGMSQEGDGDGGGERSFDSSNQAKEPVVKVAIKSASPPVDIKRRAENKRATQKGLSESAPQAGQLDDDLICEKISKLCVAPSNPVESVTAQKYHHGSSLAIRDDKSGVTSRKRLLSSTAELLAWSPAARERLVASRSLTSRRQHHHSHEQLRRSHQEHHHYHHHHHHRQHHYHHQRSLSPSCSHNYTYHGQLVQGAKDNCSSQSAANGAHQHQHQHQHHHHHNRHSTHHYHGHSHHHHHIQAHHHHNQSHGNNIYVGKHHTVPLAELRRALERQNRIVVSDAETGGSANAAYRRAYRHQLVPPPNNTPYNLEKNSLDSSDGSERRCSPAGSIEFGDSKQQGASMKKARSTTPPARYTASGDATTTTTTTTAGHKSFRSARMLRHQASLKTSSILAKLVSGATRGSAYLKKKDALHKGKSNQDRQSDLDDYDTDTDNSTRGQLVQKQDDASSNDSANFLTGGATALKVPPAFAGRHSLRELHCGTKNSSNPNMNTSIVSPLSSVSSINSTNSSLTVNSACGSSYGRDNCGLLHQTNHPAWASITCCAFDVNPESNQLESDMKRMKEQAGEAGQCTMRARSATVPCRAFCHQDSFDHPDSYLITKCLNLGNVESGLKQLENELLADRLLNRAMDESYKVSEIIKDPKDIKQPREIYHRGSDKDILNESSRESLESESRDLSSLWLGCDDGSLIVIDCLSSEQEQDNTIDESQSRKSCRNIHCEVKLEAPISDIKNYKDKIVFVALANGQLAVFSKQLDESASLEESSDPARWSLKNPKMLTLCQSDLNANSKLCLVERRQQLWYSFGRTIYVIDIESLRLETTITTPTNERAIQFSLQSINIEHLELTESLDGIWVSFKGSPLIQFYNCANFKILLEMSLLEPINKVLSYGNEIIRQHKTACLGATSLLSLSSCNDSDDETNSSKTTSLFIGTTAGIIIYLNVCHQQLREQIEAEKSVWNPQVVSLRHGHSGQVKFLRLVEMELESTEMACSELQTIANGAGQQTGGKQLCLVSAGAGIDLYGPNNEQQVVQQLSGDEDCLNHLIIWQL